MCNCPTEESFTQDFSYVRTSQCAVEVPIYPITWILCILNFILKCRITQEVGMFSDGCCTTEYSIFITEAFFKIYLCYVNIDWMPLCRCIFLYANIHVMHAVLTYSRPDFGLFLLFPFWLRVYFYQLPAESLLFFRKFQIPGYIHSNQLGSVRKKYLLSCQKWVFQFEK